MRPIIGLAALLSLCSVMANNVAHAEWHRCTPVIQLQIGQWRVLPCGPDSDTYGIQLQARINFLGEAEVTNNANANNLMYQVAAFPPCSGDNEDCTIPQYGPAVTDGISSIGLPEGVNAIAAEYWVP